jgi:NAD(P)-dependent dehydrogenase (short-subunit alcohol dehydrogenase family)
MAIGDGKVALVTGATDGLGRAVARMLAERGFAILVHGRDGRRGEVFRAELEAMGATARFYRADFSELAQVTAMADEILAREPRLDVLVNNAGIMEMERIESADGNELPFQVNYLAPYRLTRKLIPLLERSAPARIVNVASLGQAPIDFTDVNLERSWSRQQSYAQSKLAQIMMTLDMAPDLAPHGVTVTALHPGTFMPTKMVIGRFPPQASIAEGAANVVRLAADPALEGVTGRYFNGAEEAQANAQAYDGEAQQKLRALSDQLCEA